jgi:hypothetical protein
LKNVGLGLRVVSENKFSILIVCEMRWNLFYRLRPNCLGYCYRSDCGFFGYQRRGGAAGDEPV